MRVMSAHSGFPVLVLIWSGSVGSVVRDGGWLLLLLVGGTHHERAVHELPLHTSVSPSPAHLILVVEFGRWHWHG